MALFLNIEIQTGHYFIIISHIIVKRRKADVRSRRKLLCKRSIKERRKAPLYGDTYEQVCGMARFEELVPRHLTVSNKAQSEDIMDAYPGLDR